MEHCQYDRRGGKKTRLRANKENMEEKHYALNVVASKYIHLSCVWRWLSNVDIDGGGYFPQGYTNIFLPKRHFFFIFSLFILMLPFFAKLCVQTTKKAWPSRDLMGRHQFLSTTPNDDDYRSRLFLFYCTLHVNVTQLYNVHSGASPCFSLSGEPRKYSALRQFEDRPMECPIWKTVRI